MPILYQNVIFGIAEIGSIFFSQPAPLRPRRKVRSHVRTFATHTTCNGNDDAADDNNNDGDDADDNDASNTADCDYDHDYDYDYDGDDDDDDEDSDSNTNSESESDSNNDDTENDDVCFALCPVGTGPQNPKAWLPQML